MQRFLMHTQNGSIGVEDNWIVEMFTWDDDPAECQRQFDALIEVEQDENGDWIEA